MKRDSVAVEIQGLRFEYLGEDTQRAAVDNLDDWLYEFQWQPKERRGRTKVLNFRASQPGKLADLCRQRWRRRCAVRAAGSPGRTEHSGRSPENRTSERTASIFASVPNDRKTSAGSSRRLWHLISRAAVELSISGVLMLLVQRRPPWPR